MRSSITFLLCLAPLSTLACHKDAAPASDGPAASSSVTAATTVTTTLSVNTPSQSASASTTKCEALGCSGTGDFFHRCGCDGHAQTAPFEAKPLGTYDKFTKEPMWRVTNKSDKDTNWGSVAIYYYDKSGKQLDVTLKGKTYSVERTNGSSFTFKPGETKTLYLGWKQENAPPGTATMEMVFDGWCYGTFEDKAGQLCIDNPRAPEQRPRSGH